MQVGAVAGFAKATALPTFSVAFIITPLASNASELVSSLRFAMGKRKKNISLTFCQVRALPSAYVSHLSEFVCAHLERWQATARDRMTATVMALMIACIWLHVLLAQGLWRDNYYTTISLAAHCSSWIQNDRVCIRGCPLMRVLVRRCTEQSR